MLDKVGISYEVIDEYFEVFVCLMHGWFCVVAISTQKISFIGTSNPTVSFYMNSCGNSVEKMMLMVQYIDDLMIILVKMVEVMMMINNDDDT